MKHKNFSLFLLVFIVIAQVICGFYAANALEPSKALCLLYTLVGVFLIALWIKKDSEIFGVTWCREMGLMLYVFGPLFLLVYLFQTRKWKALFVVLLISFLAFGGYYIGYYATKYVM